ncbi:polysaccharide deacetylase family protein [Sphingomonas sinipercae]|uniref:Chitooligosaccharide deacetylase n=1 Tax=Sphingomonas sinipercae TaxID=2714944 RepID=A0A6G7ZNB9_9SPHN|nr:polysaccharide deacetylase family protein [Sphingomonas sinipercae]QIL02471.1 polysaccharide deacetylase family protein [Sphingomonas sinipercae]
MNAESIVTRGARRLRNLFPVAPRPVILMYHRVTVEAFDPWGLAVAPGNFAMHLRLLKRARTVLPLPEFARAHAAGTLAPNAAAITFDDGYGCNKTIAAPLLEDHSLPATIFIAAAQVESETPYWWDELVPLVMTTPKTMLVVDGLTMPLGAREERDLRWRPNAPPSSPRQNAFLAIWSHLRTQTSTRIAKAIEQIREESSVTAAGAPTLMRPEEVRQVAGDLIEIGSHALTHPSLPNIPPSERAREVSESVARCRALSGSTPRSFAYPFGDYDTESGVLVRKAGFECACTTEYRTVGKDSGSFALPRLAVGNWSAAVLHRILKGAPA